MIKEKVVLNFRKVVSGSRCRKTMISEFTTLKQIFYLEQIRRYAHARLEDILK